MSDQTERPEDSLRRIAQENLALAATIQRVKTLHVIDCPSVNIRQWCASDKMLWPCPTIRVLEEPS